HVRGRRTDDALAAQRHEQPAVMGPGVELDRLTRLCLGRSAPQRLLRERLEPLVPGRVGTGLPQVDQARRVVDVDVANLDRLAQCHRNGTSEGTEWTGVGPSLRPRTAPGERTVRNRSKPNCYRSFRVRPPHTASDEYARRDR